MFNRSEQEKSLTSNKFMQFLIIGIFALLLTGCGAADGTSTDESSSDEEKSQQEEITVAVVQDYPPFEYQVDEELTGFDVELVEAIAKEADLKVNWKIMKFDGIIPALQASQVDAAVSAITIREDRLEVVDFSDPYFESGLSLVVQKDSAIQSVEDLEGKTIVAKQGTTGLEKARAFADQYNGEVTVLQDDATMYMELNSGNSDALINDYPSVAYKIKQDGDDSNLRIVGDRLTGEDYGIAISRGSDGLVEKINNGLQELRDSGEFQEIYDKYFATE